MFVRLSKNEDNYKVPIERDWQNIDASFEEANKWVNDGWGVGLNIQRAGIKVIDIDHEISEVELEILRQAGGLVIKTIRGWHVFAGDVGVNEDLKNCNVKIRYLHDLSGEFGWYEFKNVEIYTGAATRQVVLPVIGTMRYKLGGRIMYFEGKEYRGGHTLKDFVNLIERAKSKVISIKLDDDENGSNFIYHSGRGFKALFSNWKEVSAEEILNYAKNLKKGERHNKMLTLMLLWIARGFEDDANYRGKLLEVLKDFTFADEKNLKSTQKEIDTAWEGALKRGEELKKSFGKNKKGGGKALKIIEEHFIDAGYIKEFDDLYILHDKWAIPENKIGDYLAKLGVAASDNVAKQVVAYIQGNNYENTNAKIAVNYVKRADDKLYIAANYNGENGILFYSETEGFVFKEDAENFYIKFGADLRKFSDEDFKDARDYFDKIIRVILSVYNSAYTAMLASFIVGNCRGGMIIQGQSGSGKSSASKLIQKVSQGWSGWISLKDEREIMANLANSRMVGIDESETLQRDIQEKLKSAISYGEMQVRKLFTNKELEKTKASASVILSAVEVRDLQPDMLRRSIVLTMKPKDKKISEDSFDLAVTKAMNKLLIGAIEIAGVPKSNDGMDLLELLTEGDKELQELPIWLQDASKIDIAKSFWHACQRLGISESEAKEAWGDMRGGVQKLALDAWEDVIKEFEINNEFAEKLRNGAKLNDISSYIIKDDVSVFPEVLKDERNKFANKLKNTALKVAPILKELGYSLSFDTVRERGRKLRIYYLKRDENNNRDKNNNEITTHFGIANGGEVRQSSIFDIDTDFDFDTLIDNTNTSNEADGEDYPF